MAEWMEFEASGPVTMIRKSVPTFDSIKQELSAALRPLLDVLVSSADVSPARAELMAQAATGADAWIVEARQAAVRGEPLSIEQEQQLGEIRGEAEALAGLVATAVREDPQHREAAAARALR